MNNNIGFRVKFDDMTYDQIAIFLSLYFKVAKHMEIKVNSWIDKKIIDLLYKINKSFSFHLPKYLLEGDYKNLKEESIRYLVIKFKTKNFIVHYRDNSYILSDSLEKYHYVLVENEVSSDIERYLFNFNNFVEENEMKVCLDIGHLMFSAELCNSTQKCVWKELRKYKYILKNIYEFHVHDFTKYKDHQQIGTGILDIELIKEILKEKEFPIIIETNIEELKNDGIEQIEIIKNIIG